MTRTEDRRRGSPATLLVPLSMLALFGLIAWTLAAGFNLGFSAGLSGAATIVLVYQVPALLFDWPRLTLEHVMGFFSWLWGLIASIWE